MYKGRIFVWDTVKDDYVKKSRRWESNTTNFDDLNEELENEGFSYVGQYDYELYFRKEFPNIHEEERLFVRV